MRVSGRAIAPATRVASWLAKRATVGRSKSAESYSHSAISPDAVSVTNRMVSNFAPPCTPGTASKASPGISSDPLGAFCSTSITWKSGECDRLRSGCSSSTSRSKGRSWWA